MDRQTSRWAASTAQTRTTPSKLVMMDATAEWLRDAADRHERNGEPVWALLYRNEAYRLERENSEVLR